MRSVGSFLKDAYRLAKPYFARSDERVFAWGMLIAIIVLNLTMVGMSVILNFWHREFYNAIQTKNWQAFLELLFMYRRTPSGLMPGFVELATIWIAIAVYAVYLNQWLQIRWRNWMTREFLAEWLSDRAYYHISLATDTAAVGTDNPDQRIAEDLRDFTRSTLSLGLSLLSNVVSLFSFLTILWALSGSITVFGINIPGYMVWVALIYSVLGTWLTHVVGRPLAAMNFRQQRVEADFRYALVRVRENVEGIALYHGEKEEQELLYERFSSVIGNWWAIMRRLRWLNALIAGYSQLASIFPIVVAAPRYFFGTMELGDLMQTVGAFGQVQGAMSWIIDQYSANNPSEVSLVRWRSIVERLSTFDRAVVVARATAEKISMSDSPDGSVQLRDFTIRLPDGAKLLSDADVVLEPGHSVVISGRSGSGKSTLFRAIAGIWPFGEGRVQRPSEQCMFLPQRAYLPLGTLRHVVAYPYPPEAYTNQQVADAMAAVGLAALVPRLDQDELWAQQLSGGEQQRVALARALLAKPDWLFLDEATASLDPEAEQQLYRVLREKLPHTTLVSIAHRTSVAAFHDRHLEFRRTEGKVGALEPVALEPTGGGGG
jgi:vitamin B12/bleomycin/antimicrobial peptide transport system ATP-binding/permease protein